VKVGCPPAVRSLHIRVDVPQGRMLHLVAPADRGRKVVTMFTANSLQRAFLIGCAALFLTAGDSVGFAQSAGSTTVSGTINTMSAGVLTIGAPDGTVRTVTYSPDTLILSRIVVDLSSILPGEAVGVAAKREADGSLSATSINIFAPELWKRARHGQFPMQSGEVMTNAEVVSYAVSAGGHKLSVSLGAASSVISVPDSAQIHHILAVKGSDLKTGMKVLVRGSVENDGSVTAGSINIESGQ